MLIGLEAEECTFVYKKKKDYGFYHDEGRPSNAHFEAL